ncbi:hypothetical protein LZ32DRAFT_437441 [Colletotrichum eremochloae]|nr:hypothetical protein LZ32DRAFT_437441 [Colletotrichum eremochloae]
MTRALPDHSPSRPRQLATGHFSSSTRHMSVAAPRARCLSVDCFSTESDHDRPDGICGGGGGKGRLSHQPLSPLYCNWANPVGGTASSLSSPPPSDNKELIQERTKTWLYAMVAGQQPWLHPFGWPTPGPLRGSLCWTHQARRRRLGLHRASNGGEGDKKMGTASHPHTKCSSAGSTATLGAVPQSTGGPDINRIAPPPAGSAGLTTLPALQLVLARASVPLFSFHTSDLEPSGSGRAFFFLWKREPDTHTYTRMAFARI